MLLLANFRIVFLGIGMMSPRRWNQIFISFRHLPYSILYHKAKILARKGIFAKSSISHPRISAVEQRLKGLRSKSICVYYTTTEGANQPKRRKPVSYPLLRVAGAMVQCSQDGRGIRPVHEVHKHAKRGLEVIMQR